MSKITSYFNVLSKKKTGESSSASSNTKNNKFRSSDEDKEKSVSPKKPQKATKRKQQILSDSEDEVVEIKQTSEKGQSTNGTKTVRGRDASTSKSPKKVSEATKRKQQVLSDSEDEVIEVKQTPKKGQSTNGTKTVRGRDASTSKSPKKISEATKRKQQILSDSEDEVIEVEQTSKKGQSTNGTKTVRSRDASTSKSPKKVSEPTKRGSKRQVLSDSEDEVVIVQQKSRKTQPSIQEKISPKKYVSAADVFSSKPIKRIEAPEPPKKLPEAPKRPKNLPEEDAEFYCDDAFEAALDQVEKSEVDKTTSKTNGDSKPHPTKISLNKISSKKEGAGSSKPSNSDDSFDEKNRRVNGTIDVPGDAKVSSKHFQGTKTAVKNGEAKDTNAREHPKTSGSSKRTANKSPHKGISKIEIDRNPAQKRKRNDEEGEADPFEAIVQKRKRSAALYQQYLNRGGARNPGSKEIPTGADNCLAGLSFLVTGILDSMERDEADELIKKYGGRILHQVSRKTDYVVLGDEPGPAKLEKAKHLGVKTISEDDLLELIRTRPAAQGQNDSKNIVGKKTPRKAKRKTPEPEPLGSPKRDTPPKTQDTAKVRLEDFNTKPKISVTEEQNTSKASEVGKRNDIPPVIRVPCETGSQAWVEKYKPKTMKQIIGQQGDKSNVNKLHNWLKNWQKNHSGNVKLSRPSPWAQHDGAFFKAALLSGPPGVGKTTTVQVVCEALGLDALEFNASDTRSKKLLKEEVSELLNNKSMKGYFVDKSANVASKKPALNHVLVMDEVDGMAGNEDRGGLQELIVLIKTTSVPIICICNDRNHPKMRTLSNYTYDLRFQKPKVAQIKSAMMSICFKENIKINPEDLTRLIETTNNDVRQVLNHLSLLADNPSIDETPRGRKINKDLRLGPWDVVQKVFSQEAHKTMSIHDKSDLFFHDYNIGPLFVQENYLSVAPSCPKGEVLETVADTAESLALGDLVENAIRRSNAWSLLPTQACFSSVIPGTLMSGHITRQCAFPSWLGRNSKRTKFDRLLQEITVHARLATLSSKDSINLDYVKHLRDAVIRPLIADGTDGAMSALETMNNYHLIREDLDALVEVSLWPGQRDPMLDLESKVKAALTRAFTKSSSLRPYALKKGSDKKKRAQATNEEDLEDFDGDEGEEEEEQDDSPSSDPMIKIKTAPSTSSKKPVASKEKAAAKPKKKGSNPRAGKSK